MLRREAELSAAELRAMVAIGPLERTGQCNDNDLRNDGLAAESRLVPQGLIDAGSALQLAAIQRTGGL